MRTAARKSASKEVLEQERIDKMFNHQREIRATVFARVLGIAPCVKGGEAMIHVDMDEIVEVFGPAEVKKLDEKSRRLFWNFGTFEGQPFGLLDRDKRFSLWVDIPAKRWRRKNLDVEVSAIGSQRDWENFFTWVMDRFGAVGHLDERSVALGGGFVVVPA
jgi:hypothetical protein